MSALIRVREMFLTFRAANHGSPAGHFGISVENTMYGERENLFSGQFAQFLLAGQNVPQEFPPSSDI